MKKLLLLFLLFPLALVANTDSDGFVINGVMNGGKGGKLVLMGNNNDTLAVVNIVNDKQKFVITGKIDTITVAAFYMGREYIAPIYLENRKYKAELTLGSGLGCKITGTEEQKIANLLEDMVMYRYNAEVNLDNKLYEKNRIAYMKDDTATLADVQREYVDMFGKCTEMENDIIKNNNNSFAVTTWQVAQMASSEDELVKKRYEMLTTEAQNSPYGKMIKSYLKDIEAVAVGKTIPNFKLPDTTGKIVDFYGVKGKYKLIDFWASWCGPCRGENPKVVKLYKKYAPMGLEIIGVSLDNKKDAWLNAIEADKLTWIHLSDLKGWKSEVAALFNVTGIPFTLLVDENNCIVGRNLRGEYLEDKLKELFGK